MKIGVDIRVLARGARTGIEEYLINLLPQLFILGGEHQFRLFYNSWQRASLPSEWDKFKNIQVKEFKIPNRFLSLSAKYFNAPQIDKMLSGADLFFSPHFLVTALSKKCPRIITFHDLSFEYFPEFFSAHKKFWHWSVNPKKQAKQAERIIAVSESTKDDLVDLYKIPEDKISVIYSGIGPEFKNYPKDHMACLAVKEKYNLPDNFILFFGTIEPRKNLIGLIKAFEILKNSVKDFKNIKLVLAGSRGWLCEDIFKTAKESKFAGDIIFTGFVAPEDKVYFYNLADLFIYPSFFEGFGFPPLEAMACGVPIITSNNSSLPEIVGEAGLMINAYNFGELSWAMGEALKDNELRKILIEKGLIQAQKFSWSNCASQTLTEFNDMLS